MGGLQFDLISGPMWRLTSSLGGAQWLSRRRCIFAGLACRAHPPASAGRGGGGRPVAVPRVRRGGGGGRALPAGAGGGTRGWQGVREVRRPRQGPTLGCWAWGGRGLHLVPAAHGGGTPATCVHARAGWGRLFPLLLRTSALVDAVAGAAPLRPASAPLLIKGL